MWACCVGSWWTLGDVAHRWDPFLSLDVYLWCHLPLKWSWHRTLTCFPDTFHLQLQMFQNSSSFDNITHHSQNALAGFFLCPVLSGEYTIEIEIYSESTKYISCVRKSRRTHSTKNIETVIYPYILSHLTEQYQLGGYLRCGAGRFTAVQSDTVQDVCASLYTLSIISTVPSEVKIHWYYV